MKPGGVDDRRLRGGVRGGGGAAGASRADVTLGPLRKLTKAQAVDALVKCAPPLNRPLTSSMADALVTCGERDSAGSEGVAWREARAPASLTAHVAHEPCLSADDRCGESREHLLKLPKPDCLSMLRERELRRLQSGEDSLIPSLLGGSASGSGRATHPGELPSAAQLRELAAEVWRRRIETLDERVMSA